MRPPHDVPDAPASGGLVAACYPDNSGVVRVKVVPAERLAQAAASGIGMSPVFDTFLSDDRTITTDRAGGPVGDLRLHPDTGAVRRLPMPGWQWAPVDRRRPDGSPHAQCHRSVAHRAVCAAADAGVSARIGFEIEWVVGRLDGDDFVPATTGPGYGMTRVVEAADYLRAVYDGLDAAGVGVEQLHPEYAPGQFEVALGPTDPVGAADDVLVAQEVVRAVSIRFDLRASFSPVVWPGGVGNGRHVHASVWQGDANLLAGGPGPRGMTADGERFVAGVLRSLPALVAVGCPSPVSFGRLAPGHWSGPFACWGLENREAAIRLVTAARAGDDPSANFEWKNPDATASPYLVVAGILACGVDGLARGDRLPDEVTVDPAVAGAVGAAGDGTVGSDDDDGGPVPGGGPFPGGAFPPSLGDALDALAASDVLADALGPDLHQTYVAVRRAEAAAAVGVAEADLVASYRFRY